MTVARGRVARCGGRAAAARARAAVIGASNRFARATSGMSTPPRGARARAETSGGATRDARARRSKTADGFGGKRGFERVGFDLNASIRSRERGRGRRGSAARRRGD